MVTRNLNRFHTGAISPSYPELTLFMQQSPTDVWGNDYGEYGGLPAAPYAGRVVLFTVVTERRAAILGNDLARFVTRRRFGMVGNAGLSGGRPW